MNDHPSKHHKDPVIQEYNKLAKDYDKRWGFYVHETIRETVNRLEISDTKRILDIGCGTGTLFRTVVTKYPSVKLVGVDISIEMLKIASNKLGAQAHFLTGNAQALPFRADSFDIVVSCNAFHYWRHPETCLVEIARLLKPNGLLVITDWCDDYWACRICDLYLRAFNRAHYRTYGLDECVRLLQRANYRILNIERYKINWLWGLMTVIARIDSDTMYEY